jgi:hypothetical protein
MDGVVHICKALWAIHPQRFWTIWSIITIASLVYVKWTLGNVATASRPQTARSSIGIISTLRRTWTPRTVVALILLIGFLVSYIVLILVWEDFAYYDNDLFILYSLKGHSFPLPIWRDNGRFFPFGLQEFNFIGHLTRTPIGFHIFPIAELLIFFCILLMLDAELSRTARAALAVFVLLTPSILLSFTGLIFPERNILVLLGGMALSIRQFERTKAVPWAVAAVLCAQIMLYLKETSFLLILSFAAARLLLRCGQETRLQWDLKRLWDQESRLDLCFASLAVLFLFAYFAVMGIHGNMSYLTAAHKPLAAVVLDYLGLDLLVWWLIAVVVHRLYLILRHRAVPWLLWDGLACGGVSCLFGYLNLGRSTAYFLAPVDLIAMLYVGRFLLLSWKSMLSWSKIAAVMMALAVGLQNVVISSFATFERKNVIHAKAELASAIATRYRDGMIPSVFFPFTVPYAIMEFVVYLNYRGIPMKSAALAKTVAAGNHLCMTYRNIVCHQTNGPAPGDLVVVLPDDEVSLLEASVYRRPETLLFYYKPRWPIPH